MKRERYLFLVCLVLLTSLESSLVFSQKNVDNSFLIDRCNGPVQISINDRPGISSIRYSPSPSDTEINFENLLVYGELTEENIGTYTYTLDYEKVENENAILIYTRNNGDTVIYLSLDTTVACVDNSRRSSQSKIPSPDNYPCCDNNNDCGPGEVCDTERMCPSDSTKGICSKCGNGIEEDDEECDKKIYGVGKLSQALDDRCTKWKPGINFKCEINCFCIRGEGTGGTPGGEQPPGGENPPQPPPIINPHIPQCRDGKDNDNDLTIDCGGVEEKGIIHPFDPGCCEEQDRLSGRCNEFTCNPEDDSESSECYSIPNECKAYLEATQTPGSYLSKTPIRLVPPGSIPQTFYNDINGGKYSIDLNGWGVLETGQECNINVLDGELGKDCDVKECWESLCVDDDAGGGECNYIKIHGDGCTCDDGNDCTNDVYAPYSSNFCRYILEDDCKKDTSKFIEIKLVSPLDGYTRQSGENSITFKFDISSTIPGTAVSACYINLREKDKLPDTFPLYEFEKDYVGNSITRELIPGVDYTWTVECRFLNPDNSQFRATSKEEWSILAFDELPPETPPEQCPPPSEAQPPGCIPRPNLYPPETPPQCPQQCPQSQEPPKNILDAIFRAIFEFFRNLLRNLLPWLFPPPDCTKCIPRPDLILKQCNDGIDNDGDLLVDRNDPGCLNEDDNDESNENPPATTECSNEIDDDGDGKIDAPSIGGNTVPNAGENQPDPGCQNEDDNKETDPTYCEAYRQSYSHCLTPDNPEIPPVGPQNVEYCNEQPGEGGIPIVKITNDIELPRQECVEDPKKIIMRSCNGNKLNQVTGECEGMCAGTGKFVEGREYGVCALCYVDDGEVWYTGASQGPEYSCPNTPTNIRDLLHPGYRLVCGWGARGKGVVELEMDLQNPPRQIPICPREGDSPENKMCIGNDVDGNGLTDEEISCENPVAMTEQPEDKECIDYDGDEIKGTLKTYDRVHKGYSYESCTYGCNEKERACYPSQRCKETDSGNDPLKGGTVIDGNNNIASDICSPENPAIMLDELFCPYEDDEDQTFQVAHYDCQEDIKKGFSCIESAGGAYCGCLSNVMCSGVCCPAGQECLDSVDGKRCDTKCNAKGTDIHIPGKAYKEGAEAQAILDKCINGETNKNKINQAECTNNEPTHVTRECKDGEECRIVRANGITAAACLKPSCRLIRGAENNQQDKLYYDPFKFGEVEQNPVSFSGETMSYTTEKKPDKCMVPAPGGEKILLQESFCKDGKAQAEPVNCRGYCRNLYGSGADCFCVDNDGKARCAPVEYFCAGPSKGQLTQSSKYEKESVTINIHAGDNEHTDIEQRFDECSDPCHVKDVFCKEPRERKYSSKETYDYTEPILCKRGCSDGKCNPECGNGIKEDGEECDIPVPENLPEGYTKDTISLKNGCNQYCKNTDLILLPGDFVIDVATPNKDKWKYYDLRKIRDSTIKEIKDRKPEFLGEGDEVGKTELLRRSKWPNDKFVTLSIEGFNAPIVIDAGDRMGTDFVGLKILLRAQEIGILFKIKFDNLLHWRIFDEQERHNTRRGYYQTYEIDKVAKDAIEHFRGSMNREGKIIVIAGYSDAAKKLAEAEIAKKLKISSGILAEVYPEIIFKDQHYLPYYGITFDATKVITYPESPLTRSKKPIKAPNTVYIGNIHTKPGSLLDLSGREIKHELVNNHKMSDKIGHLDIPDTDNDEFRGYVSEFYNEISQGTSLSRYITFLEKQGAEPMPETIWPVESCSK